MKKYLSARQKAAKLGVSRQAVHGMVKSGRLKADVSIESILGFEDNNEGIPKQLKRGAKVKT
jgi:DNA-binding transcriptional regulator LsrR (DeoR family)